MSHGRDKPPTVITSIEDGAQKLTSAGVSFGHGTQNAFDEAVWLVLWRLGFPLNDLDSVRHTSLSQAQQEEVASLFELRTATRKPAAYLTNEAWLQGVPFYVDERAIVPRSLIAEVLLDPDLAGQLDPWLASKTERVLDLCTGNGSLAVLAAMAFAEVVVDGADLSRDALEVAAINVKKHHLEHRISLFESDGLACTQGPYDLILCNPPYVNARSMSLLPSEYLYEPRVALDGNQNGGSDGMDFIRTLLAQVSNHMSEAAVLLLEIGNERANFEAAFPVLEFICLETSAGGDQVLLLSREMLTKATHSK